MQKILIVDDEKPTLELLSQKFSSEGFEVLSAQNAESALGFASKQPDAILLDILMPRIDGFALLKAIRSLGSWGKTVPVIVLSNLDPSDNATLEKINATGASYYLVKAKVGLGEVVEKVREILEPA